MMGDDAPATIETMIKLACIQDAIMRIDVPSGVLDIEYSDGTHNNMF